MLVKHRSHVEELPVRTGTVQYSTVIWLSLNELSYRDAPGIRPDNPAYFDIRYPIGY
jgi:hypothetical protein